METGFADLKRSWQWRGRRWLAGFISGLWLGALIGAGVAGSYDLAKHWTVVHLVGVLLTGIVVLALVRLIEGRPPKGGSPS